MPINAAEVEAVVSLRDEMSAQLTQIQRTLSTFGSQTQSNFNRAQESAHGFHAMLQEATATAMGFIAANVGVRSVGEAFNFIKGSVIDVNDLIENTAIHLHATGMSAAGARKEIADLMALSSRTPFSAEQILSVAESFQKLGGAALNTRQNMQLVVDAAAATGTGVGQLGNMVGRMYSALEAGLPISRYAMQLQRSGVVTGETVAKIKAAEAAHKDWHVSWNLITGDMQRFSGTAAQAANAGIGTITGRIKEMLSTLTAEAFRPLFEASRNALRGLADFLMSPAVETFAKQTATAVQGLVNNLSRVGQNSGLLKDMQAVFAALGPVIGDVAKATGDFFNAIQPLLPVVLSLVNDGLKAMVPLLKAVHDHFDVIMPLAVGIAAGFVAWNVAMAINNTLLAINAALAGGPGLGAFLVRVIAVAIAMGPLNAAIALFNILTALSPIVWIVLGIILLVAAIVLLITHWKQVNDFLKGEWKVVSTEAVKLWNQISNAVREAGERALGWVQSTWGRVVGAITSAWATVVSFVAGVWDQIVGAVVKGWNAVVAVLAVAGRVLYLIMVLPWAIMYAAIVLIWAAIGSRVLGALNAIRQTIASVLNAINNNVIQPVLHAIEGLFRTVWNAVSRIVGIALAAIGALIQVEVRGWENIFSAVWNAISTGTQRLWQGVIYPIWSAILGFIRATWTAIYTFITSTASAIASFVLGNANSMRNTLSSIWSGIWNTAVSWWDAIKNAISTRWGQLTNAVLTAATGLRNQLTGIWNSIATGFYSALRPVRTALNTFINAMRGFPGLGWLPYNAIPAFASGGVVTGEALGNARGAGGGFLTNRPTVLVGEGGAYPEYVIPTDPRFRKQAGALYGQLGSALGAQYLPGQMGQFTPGGGGSAVRAVPGTWGGQCVVFVEAVTGRYFPVAYASQMSSYVNASRPIPGDVGVTGPFAGSPFGHTFIYLGDDRVIDSNWVGPEMVGTHPLHIIPHVMGYIRYPYTARNSLVKSYGYGNSPGGGWDPVGDLKKVRDSILSGMTSGTSRNIAQAIFNNIFGVNLLGWITSNMRAFDRGGVWESGQIGANFSGQPEYVFTRSQLGGLRGPTINMTNNFTTPADPHDIAAEMGWELSKLRRRL